MENFIAKASYSVPRDRRLFDDDRFHFFYFNRSFIQEYETMLFDYDFIGVKWHKISLKRQITPCQDRKSSR